MRHNVLRLAVVMGLMCAAPAEPDGAASTGVLLLAHGGSAAWDANVAVIATEVNQTMPTEVALGMASRENIQRAVDESRIRRS